MSFFDWGHKLYNESVTFKSQQWYKARDVGSIPPSTIGKKRKNKIG